MAKTQKDYDAKFRAKRQDIWRKVADALPHVNWKRRKRAQKSLAAFIDAYCLGECGFLEYAPFRRTGEIIASMEDAVNGKAPYHIRMTRGGGKTSLVMCLCAKRAAYCESMFEVFVAAKMQPMAGDMIDDLWNFFENEPEFGQDFPEIAIPIRELDGSMQKANSQKFLGKRTMARKNKNEVILPTLEFKQFACKNRMCKRIVKPANDELCRKSGGNILRAAGFDAKIRGLRKGKLRPDLLVLDDLQDDEMAANPEQVEKARTKIYKTFKRLGSQKAKMSILMMSTPIQPDDLSETFAKDKKWKTKTFPLMVSMPSDEALRLWERYNEIQNAAPIGEHPETEFYKANRDAMDEGAEAFWEENFSRGDGEVSAIQHAMNMYLEDRESFESECQMIPRRAASVYDISADAVIAADNGLPRGVVPKSATALIATVDVMNVAGLRYAITAFSPSRVASVIGFGRYPSDGSPLYPKTATTDDKDEAVAAALSKILADLRDAEFRVEGGGGTMRISAVGIDAGWQTRVAHTAASVFCAKHRTGQWVQLMRGVSWSNFSPVGKTGKTRANVVSVDEWAYASHGEWGDDLMFHADYWAEASQRAWLRQPLTPGSISHFHDERANLVAFANECVADRLVSKDRLASGASDVWKWATNGANHLGDCIKMAFALAYWKRTYITEAQRQSDIAENGENAKKLLTLYPNVKRISKRVVPVL